METYETIDHEQLEKQLEKEKKTIEKQLQNSDEPDRIKRLEEMNEEI